ncbi:MAG: hypothetical protein ABR608_08665 [Pseudonocardiaceae bacterium]
MRTEMAALVVRVTTRRQDVVTLSLGAWLVGGVFADGWAHFTVPGLESFFTPWHAALYSGLAATAGWFALLAGPGLRAGNSPVAALPRGYRAGAAGAGLFALGGWQTWPGTRSSASRPGSTPCSAPATCCYSAADC